MPQTIEIESIQRLDVKPGETLVVTLPGAATQDVAALVMDQLRKAVPNGVMVMCVAHGVELSVVAAA